MILQRFYGDDAGVDDRALEQQQQHLAGMRALDLGCGNGLFCCMLCSGGIGQAVGVDYADSAVELAQGVCERGRRRRRAAAVAAAVGVG